MTMPRRLAITLLCLVPVGVFPSIVSAGTDAAGFERVLPDQVVWKDVPNGLGVQAAVVSGDPSKPGVYVVRVKFPPGISSAPHVHAEDRYAVVLKGTWYTGTDADWDPAKAVALPAGSFMKHPAGAVHFDGARDGEVILQIVGIGPSKTTPVVPSLPEFGKPHRLD
jgi:quercetin dioxygenase-like cupin family protein